MKPVALAGWDQELAESLASKCLGAAAGDLEARLNDLLGGSGFKMRPLGPAAQAAADEARVQAKAERQRRVDERAKEAEELRLRKAENPSFSPMRFSQEAELSDPAESALSASSERSQDQESVSRTLTVAASAAGKTITLEAEITFKRIRFRYGAAFAALVFECAVTEKPVESKLPPPARGLRSMLGLPEKRSGENGVEANRPEPADLEAAAEVRAALDQASRTLRESVERACEEYDREYLIRREAWLREVVSGALANQEYGRVSDVFDSQVGRRASVAASVGYAYSDYFLMAVFGEHVVLESTRFYNTSVTEQTQMIFKAAQFESASQGTMEHDDWGSSRMVEILFSEPVHPTVFRTPYGTQNTYSVPTSSSRRVEFLTGLTHLHLDLMIVLRLLKEFSLSESPGDAEQIRELREDFRRASLKGEIRL